MLPEEMEGSERQSRSTTTTNNNNNRASHKVLVAVKAEKVISKAALAWALTHVVHPGDCITLLAIIPKEKTSRRFWNFTLFRGDCSSSQREKLPEKIHQISESCSQMALQFRNQIEVKVRIKVVSSSPGGAVAAEAKSNGVNWVVLDKKLKQERKRCMEELQCNIVVMKGGQPKVLRLNLGCSNELQTPFFSATSTPGIEGEKLQGHQMKQSMVSTPQSSPEESRTSHTRNTWESSRWSYDTASSLLLVYGQNPLFEGQHNGIHKPIAKRRDLNVPLSTPELNGQRFTSVSKPPTPSLARNQKRVLWIPQNHLVDEKSPTTQNYGKTKEIRSPTSKSLLDKFVDSDQDMGSNRASIDQMSQGDHTTNSSIRDAVSIGRNCSIPPPLCPQCQHKAPVFGKPPRHFSYKELEEATDGFSDINFLAEGGFSTVHRGMLRDGQAVVVKRLKFGNNTTLLDWQSRLKIAIGTARGLRYIHEDCRVGSIAHRDLRPNNILLTHEFEPLIAGFGLARWHSEWDISTEDQVIGTSGYLAPEYLEGGQITNKVDVYAFGKRMDELQYIERQQFLSEWFHPLAALEPGHVIANNYHLLDPCLACEPSFDFPHQLEAMCRAASLCLRRDPESRPPMSKVLRVLEGGDLVPLGLDLNTVGCRSGHLGGISSFRQPELKRKHSQAPKTALSYLKDQILLNN
ncbi:inactive protein kinase [Quercus suber]|uniref:Inactive protein kinase n=1 Tax=Quercus suber TaxID=58331 RepID=A0AAW0IM75_QUESU